MPTSPLADSAHASPEGPPLPPLPRLRWLWPAPVCLSHKHCWRPPAQLQLQGAPGPAALGFWGPLGSPLRPRGPGAAGHGFLPRPSLPPCLWSACRGGGEFLGAGKHQGQDTCLQGAADLVWLTPAGACPPCPWALHQGAPSCAVRPLDKPRPASQGPSSPTPPGRAPWAPWTGTAGGPGTALAPAPCPGPTALQPSPAPTAGPPCIHPKVAVLGVKDRGPPGCKPYAWPQLRALRLPLSHPESSSVY